MSVPNPQLDYLLSLILAHAPQTTVREEEDGNISLVTNLHLDSDQSTLVPFEDEEGEIE
jgi:hypothetical protein